MPLNPNQLINDRYKVVSLLNNGSFGSVSLAKDTWNRNSLVAIKSISLSSPHAQDALDEISIHAKLGTHPHICSLLDSFHDSNHTHLVMEYCQNGDLYDAIRSGKSPSSPDSTLRFMLQLIAAVDYAHSKGVFHRDIKPENILIAADGSVRLADWGLATTTKHCSEFGAGSLRYMAPELFDQELPHYNPAKADFWAIGISLLNILFAHNPFSSASQDDKLFLDFAASPEALFDIFPTLSVDVFLAIRHLLAIDPEDRSLVLFREKLIKVDVWVDGCDDFNEAEESEFELNEEPELDFNEEPEFELNEVNEFNLNSFTPSSPDAGFVGDLPSLSSVPSLDDSLSCDSDYDSDYDPEFDSENSPIDPNSIDLKSLDFDNFFNHKLNPDTLDYDPDLDSPYINPRPTGTWLAFVGDVDRFDIFQVLHRMEKTTFSHLHSPSVSAVK